MTSPRHSYGFLTWGKVLRFIDEYQKEHQFPPTYREMADALNVRSTSTVANHVELLVARGLLSRIPDSPRAIALTEKGKALLPPPKEAEDDSAH